MSTKPEPVFPPDAGRVIVSGTGDDRSWLAVPNENPDPLKYWAFREWGGSDEGWGLDNNPLTAADLDFDPEFTEDVHAYFFEANAIQDIVLGKGNSALIPDNEINQFQFRVNGDTVTPFKRENYGGWRISINVKQPNIINILKTSDEIVLQRMVVPGGETSYPLEPGKVAIEGTIPAYPSGDRVRLFYQTI